MSDVIDEIEGQEEKEQLWTKYIGYKAPDYIEKWRNIENGYLLSFNIGAFFFGALWMLYRKMYIPHLVWVAFLILEGVFEDYLKSKFGIVDSTETILLTNLVFATVIGFIANWMYYKDSQRKILYIADNATDQNDLESKLVNAGGTSMESVFIALLIYASLFYLVGRFFETQ